MVVPVFATPNQDLWNALMENNLEAAKTALDNGADIKAKAPDYTDDIEDDMKDWTVLMLAIVYEMEPESIKFLIDNGVDLDYKLTEGEAKGGSALVIAEIVGHTEAADLLIAAGATLDEEQQTLVNGFKMERTSYRMASVERTIEEFWEKYGFYPKVTEEKDSSEVISEIGQFRSIKENNLNQSVLIHRWLSW